MKELSIEEKAKAYDGAFRIAQELYNNPNSSHIGKGYVCTVFPELRESEDDRIRKEFCEDIWTFIPNEKAHKYIAWLEKQGQTFTKKDIDDAYLKGVTDTKNEIEKQDEQKSADKVEPKFKVGDIVQYITDSTDKRKIEEVDELCNMYHTDSSPIMFEVEDEWKISVLAEDVEFY